MGRVKNEEKLTQIMRSAKIDKTEDKVLAKHSVHKNNNTKYAK